VGVIGVASKARDDRGLLKYFIGYVSHRRASAL
jgi:hypothetical protein